MKMKITDIKQLHGTEWLALKQASCLNKDGKHFKWDYVSRNGHQKVVILLCHSIDFKKILLIKEFRVPLNQWVIEFPKGLINQSESINDAALRELKEETGYDGTIIKIHPFMATSAYLTDETTITVEIEIDENKMGSTHHEDAEEIVPFWMEKATFEENLQEYQEKGYIIENNVWFFFKGLKQSNF